MHRGTGARHRERIKDEPVATPDDVVWADVVLFGSPTRFGNVTSQLKQFIDMLGPQWGQGLLANKVYAGFTSSQTAHGGQEPTLLGLYNTIHTSVASGGPSSTPSTTWPSGPSTSRASSRRARTPADCHDGSVTPPHEPMRR